MMKFERGLGLSVAVLGVSMFASACAGPSSSSMSPSGPSSLSSLSSSADGGAWSGRPAEDPGCLTAAAQPISGRPSEPPPPCIVLSGRFTGGGFQIEPDPIGKLTYGFTIHCDLLLSNNLELNWNGNQFHMLEHLTTATCDTIGLAPNPPVAGVNRIIGVGTGRYNGTDGYTINFTLIDHSEPGVNDEVAFVITGPGGVVINVPLSAVEGGNVQAHEDQPHKNVL